MKIISIILLVLLVASMVTPLVSYEPAAAQTSLQRLYVQGNVIRDSGGPFFIVGGNYRGQAHSPGSSGMYDDWSYAGQDADRMKALGFNTIRLWVFWEQIETSRSPSEFTYNAAYIDKIRQTVEIFNSHGIYVIIDLHTASSVNTLSKFIPTLGNDMDFADAFYSSTSSTSAREHLKRVWLKLSESLIGYSGVAAYGILNEPHHSRGSLSDQQVANYWFNIADYVIAALRAKGDKHIASVCFSPGARTSVYMSRELKDQNVVYEIHFYYGIDAGALTVTNNGYTWLKQQFDSKVNDKMVQYNVPFILGEQGFGINRIKSGDSRDVWLKNSLKISKGSPNMQGYLYFGWISYGGNTPYGYSDSSFWGRTAVSYLSDKPIKVHYQ